MAFQKENTVIVVTPDEEKMLWYTCASHIWWRNTFYLIAALLLISISDAKSMIYKFFGIVFLCFSFISMLLAIYYQCFCPFIVYYDTIWILISIFWLCLQSFSKKVVRCKNDPFLLILCFLFFNLLCYMVRNYCFYREVQSSFQDSNSQKLTSYLHTRHVFGYCQTVLGVSIVFSILRLYYNKYQQSNDINSYEFDAPEFVNGIIANDNIVMISKSECPFCIKAYKLLAKYNQPIIKVDIDIYFIGDYQKIKSIQDYCKIITGSSTVPKIFIGGKFIGGYSEIEMLHKSQKLGTLIYQ